MWKKWVVALAAAAVAAGIIVAWVWLLSGKSGGKAGLNGDSSSRSTSAPVIDLEDRDELASLLKNCLPADSAQKVAELIRPGVRIAADPAHSQKLRPGQSRLGGLPDLPGDVVWPTANGKPLPFVAQVNLAEIEENVAEMPTSGVLYFFYDAGLPQPEQPQFSGGWKVVYYAGNPAALKPSPRPKGLEAVAVFKQCAMSFWHEYCLPDDFVLNGLLTNGDRTRYDEQALSAYEQSVGDVSHRLGGYPDVLQEEMEPQCQQALDDRSGGRVAGQQGDLAKARDWMLLLQVDSDDDAGMRWGSGGRLYFWIRRQDLQARDFGSVMALRQTYGP